MKRTRTVAVWAALALWPAVAAVAGPEPSLAPTSWQLDFEFHDPQRIRLTLPGDTSPTTFWYLLFTVTNRTGQEVEFYPSFDLMTDTLDVVKGNSNIAPAVYDALQARYRATYPFMVEPNRLYGVLRQGVDNRRTCAVAFRDFDPDANRFTIYVGGLSGELVRLQNPVYNPLKVESDNNPRYHVLRKTLAIEYGLPGDRLSRKMATPVRVRREWVMR